MNALQKYPAKTFKGFLLAGTISGRVRKAGPLVINRKLSIVHHFVKWAINNEHMEHDTCLTSVFSS